MKIDFSLNGRTAVITGAAGVICSNMAGHLARNGAKIALLDLNAEKAAAMAEEIKKDGGDAIAVKVDVLDKQSIEKAKYAVLKQFGRVDILINGAGGNKQDATTSDKMDFFDMPADALQWVFNLNFVGTVLTTQVFGKLMAAQKDRKSVV